MERKSVVKAKNKAWAKKGLVFFLGLGLILGLYSGLALPEEGKRSAKSPGWWSPAEKVTNNSVHDWSPSIAVDENLVVHVAFQSQSGPGDTYEIYYKNNASGVFGPAQRVTNNSVNDRNPSLAVSGGYAHVAFESYSGSGGTSEIYYKYGRSGKWYPAQRVTNNDVFDWVPSLDISGGYAHVAFQSQSGPGNTYEIYYKIGRAGRWYPAQRVTNNSVYDFNPSLDVSGGYAHVAFQSNSGSGGTSEIYYKYGRSGKWYPAQRVTNNDVWDWVPSLDISGGYAHVAFESNSGPGPTAEIYYKYGRSGRWYPAQRVTNNSVDDTNPSMAVTDGVLVDIVFESQEAPDTEIYYKWGFMDELL